MTPGIYHSTLSLVIDYLKFVIYSALIIIPFYALIHHLLNGNWLYFILEILLIPIAFFHGLLLIFNAIFQILIL